MATFKQVEVIKKWRQPALLDFLLSKSSRYINKAVVYMNPLINVSSLFISGTVNKLRKGKDKNWTFWIWKISLLTDFLFHYVWWTVLSFVQLMRHPRDFCTEELTLGTQCCILQQETYLLSRTFKENSFWYNMDWSNLSLEISNMWPILAWKKSVKGSSWPGNRHFSWNIYSTTNFITCHKLFPNIF